MNDSIENMHTVFGYKGLIIDHYAEKPPELYIGILITYPNGSDPVKD